MINFISPPTDSFYKFMGIGGLLLFIVCGIFIFSGMYKEDYKLTLSLGEIQIQERKLKTIVDDLEYLPEYQNLDYVDVSKLKSWVDDLYNESFSTDSILVQSYYALPDSVREEMLSILLIRLEKLNKYNALAQRINEKKSIQWLVIVGLYIGEILGILGIVLWYKHIQKPLDDERKNQESQKLFFGTDLSTHCNSCYMTFYFNNERGTEKDGSINRFFCKECYDEGEYIEPDLTFDEAKKRLIQKLNQFKYKSKRVKKAEKKFETLLRWDRLKTW